MADTGTDALTRLLARREYSLVAQPRSRFWQCSAWAACLVLGGTVVYGLENMRISGLRGKESSNEIILLKSANRNLIREIEELRMRLAHDGAALEALQNDYAAQVEALRQANRNLAFYRKNLPGVVPDDK